MIMEAMEPMMRHLPTGELAYPVVELSLGSKVSQIQSPV